MQRYKITDSIPLTFIRMLDGAPVSGLDVTVIVQNEKTGTILLSSEELVEVSSGLYTYEWTHGQSGQTHCVATYTVGGKGYKEFFIIDDLIDRIDHNDGNAV